MRISLIIITLNEGENIRDCLTSIYAMDFPLTDFEVIVVDGNSKDSTLKIVEEFRAKKPNLKLVIEERKGAAMARKVGVLNASYEWVAFTDADCEVPVFWLKILKAGILKYLPSTPSLVAVGGGNTGPTSGSNFLQALSIALNTFVGSFGSVQGTIHLQDRPVNSLATLNVVYNKSKLINAGNFNSSLLSFGEDAEINFRLRKAGYTFYYLANCNVFHKFRPTLKSWFKNMLRYGRARGMLLKMHPDMWQVCYILPILFLTSFLLLPFYFINLLFLLPLLYFPIIIVYSWLLAFKNRQGTNIFLISNIFYVFLLTHYGYAYGMVKELLNSSVSFKNVSYKQNTGR